MYQKADCAGSEAVVVPFQGSAVGLHPSQPHHWMGPVSEAGCFLRLCTPHILGGCTPPVCKPVCFFSPGLGKQWHCFAPELLMSPGRARLVFPLPPGAPGPPDETSSLCWQSAAGDNNKKRIQASPQRGHLPLTSLAALLWGVYKNCTCCNSCWSCWEKNNHLNH